MNSGFTIPIVDISKDTFRQTVVDREPGLYIGHPTTVLLDDDRTIIAVYPKCHGNGQICMKKSLDGGWTWSERLPVPPSWSTSMEVPTIYKTYDKSGARHLIMFSGMHPIRMAHSEDDGDTWSELEPIGDFGGIVAMGDLCNTAPGEYYAYFHDDGRFFKVDVPYGRSSVYATGVGADRRTRVSYAYSEDEGRTWGEEQKNWVFGDDRPGDKWEKIHESFFAKTEGETRFTLYQVKSTDGGLTWGKPQAICRPTPEQGHLCEPGVVRSPDGKQLAMLLRENSRKHNSNLLISNDNSRTWEGPYEMQGALTGDRHCVRYLKDGRIFVSFRDTCLDTPTSGDWCAWVGTYDDIVNRREGQYRVRIMKNHNGFDCAYPGVIIMPDGTIVATTYGHWTEGEKPYVVTVHVHPDELDAIYNSIKQ